MSTVNTPEHWNTLEKKNKGLIQKHVPVMHRVQPLPIIIVNKKQKSECICQNSGKTAGTGCSWSDSLFI